MGFHGVSEAPALHVYGDAQLCFHLSEVRTQGTHQFLKELHDPEESKGCQVLNDNPEHRECSLGPSHTRGANKHGN